MVRDSRVFKFGIFADLHLNFSPRDCGCQKGVVPEPLERLELFLDAMERRGAHAVLNLGDFSIDFNHHPSAEALNLWRAWKGAKVSVLGNHDFQSQSKSDYTDAMSMPGTYYSRVICGMRFCILDSSSRTEPHWQGADCPSKEQLTWLERELLKSQEKCIIAMHGGFWPDLRLLIDRVHRRVGEERVVAYFFGHHHLPAACRLNRVWYIGLNSISYRWIGDGVDRTYWYQKPLYSIMSIEPETGSFELTGNGSTENWATEFCTYQDPREPDPLTYQISLPGLLA